MSFKEVNHLRKCGHLKEALKMAEADLESEDGEWSRSAMFWVLRDRFNMFYSKGEIQLSQQIFTMMQNLLKRMDDEEGYASRSLDAIAEKLCPGYLLIEEATELSKKGQEEEAYERMEKVHAAHPIEELLHEKFGWIIFRYLQKHFGQIGSLKSRLALFVYMNLHNARPSLLHSQMLNLASKISETYPGFKLLPFLKLWNTGYFMDADLHDSEVNGKIIQPLAIRIFRHCIALGYTLDECTDDFCKNKKIRAEDLLLAYCQQSYYDIFKLSKENVSSALAAIEKYIRQTEGRARANKFNSKIIRSYLFLTKDNTVQTCKEILEAFGTDDFMDEDWVRENRDDEKEYPSLVERFIKRYMSSLTVAESHIPSKSVEPLLKEAIVKYPDDDQMPRYLAQCYLAWGQKGLALEEYRKLLLKDHRFYLWKELALIIEDHALKVSALCKAILSQPEDEFLGEVHILLANLLIDEGAYPQACRELNSYAQTYARKGWQLKGGYSSAMKGIPAGTIPAKSNEDYYRSHENKADEFVYSMVPRTTMVVVDIFSIVRSNGKKKEQVKLVSADGDKAIVSASRLRRIQHCSTGSCFEVKIVSGNGKEKVGLIRESKKDIKDVFASEVGYVQYYNTEKKIAHVYDHQSRHFLIRHAPFLKSLKFIRFYPVMEKDNSGIVPQSQKMVIPQGLFASKIEDKEALKTFPDSIGIVDHVNESKQLFHCAFGKDNGAVVIFSSTSIRPKTGDVVVAKFIFMRNKEGERRNLIFDIKIDNDRQTPLLQNFEGEVKIKLNRNGELFGFVKKYYVPGKLLGGVESGDMLQLKALFDGEKWRVFAVNKKIQ